jgi:uncharacterized damage-inducible protein DinB
VCADRIRRPFRLDEATAMLVRTPAILDAWLRDLPTDWVTAHEGGETWSVFDVLGHLIHGERTDWVPRARIILAEGDSRAFDPFDRFAQFEQSRDRTLDSLLDEFTRLRRQSLHDLASSPISEADLDRHGRHPALGRVTLRQLLATWVAHDFDHLAQIARVLARQYSDEVGPWRAYLRVISGQPG